MKTITIRLTDVEAAMLEELRRRNKLYRQSRDAFVDMISRDYRSMTNGRSGAGSC